MTGLTWAVRIVLGAYLLLALHIARIELREKWSSWRLDRELRRLPGVPGQRKESKR